MNESPSKHHIHNFIHKKNKKKVGISHEDPNKSLCKDLHKSDKIIKHPYNKNVHRFCRPHDEFVKCVWEQRSIGLLKENAIFREKAISARRECTEFICEAFIKDKNLEHTQSLVKLNELPLDKDKDKENENDIQLQEASPNCSEIDFRNVFTLEKKIWNFSNPVILQNQLKVQPEEKCLQFMKSQFPDHDNDLNKNCCNNCCCMFYKSPFDMEEICQYCLEFGNNLYEIPKDLKGSFRFTKLILGHAKIERQKKNIKQTYRSVHPCESASKLKNQSTKNENLLPIACLYVAFATTFEIRDENWTDNIIDEILISGKKLFEISVAAKFKDINGNFDILTEIPDKSISIEICGPCYDGILTYSDPNILKSLICFFNDGHYNACIFCSKDVFLLIWQQCCNVYKIFDSNGRNENYQRDDDVFGAAGIIETNSVMSIIHIIINLSGLNYDDRFKLYGIKISNYQRDNINQQILNFLKFQKSKQILILNSSYGIVPAAIGLDQDTLDSNPNISMFISLIAIVYSYIDPSNYWRRTIISRLIEYSIENYAKYKKISKIDKLNVENLPKLVVMGTYKIILNICSYAYSGHIRECFTFKNSNLAKSLERFFNTETAGLLQIDNQTLAIWYDKVYFYVFDSVQRDKMGRVMIDKKPKKKTKTKGNGCLQIHVTFDSMCRMIYWNSLKMMSNGNGNFFLHAVKIESLNAFSANSMYATNKTEKILYFDYPFSCEIKNESAAFHTEKEIKMSPDVPENCLSELSLSPCQRTCSESEFIAAKKREKNERLLELKTQVKDSLTSIEGDNYFPEYDKEEIVEGTLKLIMCSIMSRITAKDEIEEKKQQKSACKKFLKNKKLTEKDDEDEKNVIKKDDFTSISESYEQLLHDFTVSKLIEAEQPTNFVLLPDGISALFGTKTLAYEDKQQEYNIAVYSSIVTATLSQIYDIATWNKTVIDFIIDSAEGLNDILKLKAVIPLILDGKLPKIEFDSKIYQVSVEKFRKSIQLHHLNHKIQKYFKNCRNDHLLIICNSYAAIILEKGNFIYLFNAYPSDIMGFRMQKDGKPCLLRLQNFDDLIHRINFNRFNENIEQKFLILSVNVKLISIKKHDADGNQIHDKNKTLEEDLMRKNIQKERKKFKKIKKELAKLEAEKRKKAGKSENQEDQEEDDQNEKNDSDEDRESKSDQIFSTKPIYEEFEKQTDQCGYCFCEETCLYKIQGTFSLPERMVGDRKTVRSCFCTSIYALMHSIVTPLSHWNFRRVDKVLENGTELYEKFKDKSIALSRKIKNVIVDKYEFHIKVMIYKPLVPRPPLDIALKKMNVDKRHFIIQISNSSYAIYRDQCWHLFDSYKPSEYNKKEEQEEEEEEEENEEKDDNDEKNNNEKKKPKCSASPSVKKIPDKDTASWILFADLISMLEYIKIRAVSEKWIHEYRIHVIEILSYQKISEKLAFSLQSPNDENNVIGDDESNINSEAASKMIPEKISWLEIPWSYLTSTSKICNRYPSLNSSKMCKCGSYKVEIPGKVYSLWGNLDPNSPDFNKSHGREFLAINVMACCMAHIYRFSEWNSNVIDEIIKHGCDYYQNTIDKSKPESKSKSDIGSKSESETDFKSESKTNSKSESKTDSKSESEIEPKTEDKTEAKTESKPKSKTEGKDSDESDHHLKLENLNTEYRIGNINFEIHIEGIFLGQLYSIHQKELNLCTALTYLFSISRYGIIHCMNRYLTFGHDAKGYFLFDCQLLNKSLFENKKNKSAYVLWCKTFHVLLYCIVIILGIRQHNVHFFIYKIDLSTKQDENEIKKSSHQFEDKNKEQDEVPNEENEAPNEEE